MKNWKPFLVLAFAGVAISGIQQFIGHRYVNKMMELNKKKYQVINEENVDESLYKKYHNQQYNVSIYYPRNWGENEIKDELVILDIIQPKTKRQIQIRAIDAFIIAGIEKIARDEYDFRRFSDETLNEWFEEMLKKYLVGTITDGTVTTVVKEIALLNNTPCIHFLHKINIRNNTIMRESYLFLFNGIQYEVVGVCSESDKLGMLEVKKSLKTFKYSAGKI